MKQIAIVENEEKYRNIVREELSSRTHWSLSFFTSAEEFLNDKNYNRFDLIYVDINLIHMNGIDLVNTVWEKNPELKMVMLTGLNTDSYIFSALQAGAIGYLLKTELSNLVYATDIFLEGGSFINPVIAFRIQTFFKRKKSNLKEELTQREIQIIEMIVQTESTERIADILKISINTVKNHIRNIYTKLQVNSRSNLVIKAMEIGIGYQKNK
ncbi:MAG TPA: response regulator transcription factor [Leptospiraceae bacterium]|nr:response regulator transcription factor [Leptospiraceae bacterium]HMW04953.1 response regulator transcription factor [Leptospiraceae bacterium]HMX31898.1 response regulator transcription factor [Leptospiraceae bacterium]HMY30826.1 response regulator transcription factor [Leptospiraceae bacterium]HMZ64287.1 response regulator transcription factor [Leptospiraceae bacterium]